MHATGFLATGTPYIYIFTSSYIYIHTCSHFGSSKMGSSCTCSRRAATELPVADADSNSSDSALRHWAHIVHSLHRVLHLRRHWAHIVHTLHRVLHLRRLWSALGHHLRRYTQLRSSVRYICLGHHLRRSKTKKSLNLYIKLNEKPVA